MECFTVWSNDIEERVDPFYYKPKFREFEKKIIKNKFRFVRFNDVIKDISGGATPRVEEDFYCDDGIPFLRVQNITEEGINLEDVKFIKKEVHEGMLKRSQLHEDELVFTITGRIGNVAVIPKGFEGNINQHSVRIKLKDKFEGVKISPHYIALFFNLHIGQILSFRKTTGGTRPALDYSAIRNLIIPLPPFEIQNRIVELMDNVYNLKKQKETEAHQLLDSINDYVLNELDIKLPNSKDKMTYVVYADDVKEKRADAYYHQPKFVEAEKAIKRGKYEIKKLKEIVNFIPGYAFSSQDYIDSGIKLLTIKNIKFSGLDFTSVTYLPKKYKLIYKKYLIKKNSILIAMTGATIGKTCIFESDEKILLNQRVGMIKSKKVDIIYLNAYFSTQLFRNEVVRKSCGGAQPNISENGIMSLIIPHPPLSIQNKIANEVKRRMYKAKQLQEEAEKVLEEAKLKVERIILGEEEI